MNLDNADPKISGGRHAAGSLAWVVREIADLRAYGFHPVVFGGWAKELLGAWRHGPHGDLDLLIVLDDIARLDAFVRDTGREPFGPKLHHHKRAYVSAGALVEMFHVVSSGDGVATDFYGRYRRSWLLPLGRPVDVPGVAALDVVTAENIIAYERDHPHVQDALFVARPELRMEVESLYGEARIPYHKYFQPQ